ncbi:hypothetical protein [Thiofilum flexile]|uniref:hypothetical protein n=1 Tax=Thiofilum flexile TaxID=125627 RepID=UPI00036A7DC3|nr:hypothetical protein [Thiofilum flexile]
MAQEKPTEIATDALEKIDTATLIQLVLAEHRTALATLRTGIAILVLPMSVVSFLIATSRYYTSANELHLLLPLLLLSVAIMLLGCYLVLRSVKRMHQHEKLIAKIKCEHPAIQRYLD